MIIHDLPADQYHVKKLGELSSSGIKQLLRTPAHYKAWVESDTDKQTPALLFGRALHCALLEPDVFAKTYTTEAPPESAPRRPSISQRNAAKPSPATLDAIAFWDQWDADHAGLESISAENLEKISAMVASVQATPLAMRAISGGKSEVTATWLDEETGLPCKARADYFVNGKFPYVLDVKTCEDASPAGFARACAKYGYHIQHAHYCEGFRANGVPLTSYWLLAIEKEPPYAVGLYHLDAEAERRGYELRGRAAAKLKECVETGQWPAYAREVKAISLPKYALTD